MYTAQLGLALPIAIRYPRGKGQLTNWKQPFEKIEIGRGVQLKEGYKTAVLSVGAISENVKLAIDNSNNKDAIAHYDMRFIKPLDESLLNSIFEKHEKIITV